MKRIAFKWNNVVHIGTIVSQKPHKLLGAITKISINKFGEIDLAPGKMDITLIGQCALGKCGPYFVISIEDINPQLN